MASNQVLLKKSSVAAKVPLVTDLAYGEVALNYADGKLYYKNSSNLVKYFSNDTFATDITVNGITVGVGTNGGAGATALGRNALINNTTGLTNIAIGAYSLSANTTGNANIGIGYNALGSNLIGSNNVAIGNVLGNSNSDNNLAIGYGMGGAVSQSIGIGTNIANGSNVTDSILLGVNAFSNSIFTSVVGIGSQVYSQGTLGIGAGSIAIGYQAGYSSNTAIQTLIGYQAGFSATARGNNNTAIGYQTLYNNGVGSASSTISANNTAIGHKTLFAQTTGRNNTAIGHQAGWGSAGTNAVTTGYQNTYIGYFTVGSAATNSNEIVIGANAIGLGTGTTTIGATSANSATIYGVHYATNYTVAGLPAATVGARAFVTDANNPIVGTTVVGGGTTAAPVYNDGTNWICDSGTQTNISGNAATVTTNANLTGNVTSIGNATTLVSIPVISGANLTNLTPANISTGLATISVTGNAATVTTNANLTGVVTSVGNATSIADASLAIAKTSGLQSTLDAKALQDGTILYHSTKWFVPSSTVTVSSGTTVTSVGTQFTSAMVGAKLTISGESKLIIAFTNSTTVTVDSAYSINYSAVVAGSWGVFSRFMVTNRAGVPATYNVTDFYGWTGVTSFIIDGSTFSIDTLRGSSNNVNFTTNELLLGGNRSINWTNNVSGTNEVGGTRDTSLRRNAAGILEIYDGVTATGLIANRRDLLVRNVTASIISTINYTVATLPSASTSGVGARAFVTDALAPVVGATVVTGGAISVPVYSDGTNWRCDAGVTNTLTIGTGLSGTSYNGSIAVTVAIDSTVATLTGTQTLTNKTLSSAALIGTLTAGGGVGTTGQVLSSTGTGVQWITGGVQGATGATGLTGVQGATGATGLTGIQGASGSTGLTGVQGATGLTGIQGASGSTGLTGIQGASGSTGLTGIQGASGSTGLTGITGASGASGSTGITGASGSTGPTGTGVQGASGSTGIQGASGPTGTGVQGASGSTGFIASITNDTATNASYYPALFNAISGSPSTAYVANSKLYFNPASGILSATAFTSLSDIAYKENIETLVNSTAVVQQLTGVSYSWKDTGNKSYGVIAQELEKVLPELVDINSEGIKSVNYSGIIAFLINSIKEQQLQIDELYNKLK